MRVFRWSDWLLAAFAAAIIASFAGMRPAQAADIPTCPGTTSIPEIVAAVERTGGVLLDMIELPGDGFDQALFFAKDGMIVVGLASLGCVVSSPIALGRMRETTPA